jgi:hypothetical protein
MTETKQVTIPGYQASLGKRWHATDPYDAFGREIEPGMIIMKPPSSNYEPELLKVTHRKGDAIYVEGKRAKLALPGRCIIVTESIPEFVTVEVDV